jgi:hypothetical protein
MSIPGCNCARCLQGYPHTEPMPWPGGKNSSTIAPPILSERDPRIVMDPKPAPERYAAFNALLREIKTLHDSKGADYEDGGEEYSNLTAAEDWGIPAWKYAMLRTNEKLNRLKAHAKGSTLQHEGARDSMIDIAVLSLIAIVLKERA